VTKASTKVSKIKVDFYHNVLISFHVYSYNFEHSPYFYSV